MTKEVLCGKCDNCGHEHYIKLYKTFYQQKGIKKPCYEHVLKLFTCKY